MVRERLSIRSVLALLAAAVPLLVAVAASSPSPATSPHRSTPHISASPHLSSSPHTSKKSASAASPSGKVSGTRSKLGVNVQQGNGGAAVVAVQHGGPAQKAGIQHGDVITSVNGQPTSSPQALSQVLSNLSPGQTATVQAVEPNGTTKTFHLKVASSSGSSSHS